MQKWEYKIIRGSDTSEAVLSGYGDEGWELVAAAEGADGTFRLYMKRPKIN